MTPTLIGRWQTRLLLLGTLGVADTLIFGRLYNDFITPLTLLAYAMALGFIWDFAYNFVQGLRWDRDWPPVFQLIAGIIEGAFLWSLVVIANANWFGLPALYGVSPNITFFMFLAHYTTVWLTAFLASQGLLRIIFPRWRFSGGKWM